MKTRSPDDAIAERFASAKQLLTTIHLPFRPRLRRAVHPHPGRHLVLWLDGQDRPLVVPRGGEKGWGLLQCEAPPGDHLQPPGLRAVPGSGLGAELGRQRGKVGLVSKYAIACKFGCVIAHSTAFSCFRTQIHATCLTIIINALI